jgi:ArsR family metal-binding transcriptional regulator
MATKTEVKQPKLRVSVESMQNLKGLLPSLKEAINAVEGETKKKSLLLTFAAFEKKILNIKPETGTAIKAIKEAMKAGKKITIEE